jgi:hypothetical protein
MTCLGGDDHVYDRDVDLTAWGAWIAMIFWIALFIIYTLCIFLIGTPVVTIIFIYRWAVFIFGLSSDYACAHAGIAAKYVLYFRDLTNPVTKPPFEDSDYPL